MKYVTYSTEVSKTFKSDFKALASSISKLDECDGMKERILNTIFFLVCSFFFFFFYKQYIAALRDNLKSRVNRKLCKNVKKLNPYLIHHLIFIQTIQVLQTTHQEQMHFLIFSILSHLSPKLKNFQLCYSYYGKQKNILLHFVSDIKSPSNTVVRKKVVFEESVSSDAVYVTEKFYLLSWSDIQQEQSQIENYAKVHCH